MRRRCEGGALRNAVLGLCSAVISVHEDHVLLSGSNFGLQHEPGVCAVMSCFQ